MRNPVPLIFLVIFIIYTRVTLVDGEMYYLRNRFQRQSPVAMPAAQLTSNFSVVDASNDRFAYDYVQNIFVTIEPKAILFVQGDNI